mgnify:CR=1 FL=1
MIEINNELITAMRRFKEMFGEIVPLRELPQNVTNEDLIAAINDSIEQNRDLSQSPACGRFRQGSS